MSAAPGRQCPVLIPVFSTWCRIHSRPISNPPNPINPAAIRRRMARTASLIALRHKLAGSGDFNSGSCGVEPTSPRYSDTPGTDAGAAPSVVPGPYKVTVESPGMKTFEGTLTVRTQESEVVDVTLHPGTTATSITVQDVTPIVKTDSPDLGHTLEQTQIQELPINGRLVGNLLNTVPGLTGDRAFGVRLGTHDMILDGAPLTDELNGGFGFTAGSSRPHKEKQTKLSRIALSLGSLSRRLAFRCRLGGEIRRALR